MTKYAIFAMLAAAAAIATNAPAAKAEPAVGIAVSAPLTPVTFAAAAVLTVLANEAFAKKPFGENGEIMKALAVPVKIIDGNVKASERESGEIAKVLRATTGISVRDIELYGVFGGPNSVFRKPFG
jgi:hypothetical protein